MYIEERCTFVFALSENSLFYHFLGTTPWVKLHQLRRKHSSLRWVLFVVSRPDREYFALMEMPILK